MRRRLALLSLAIASILEVASKRADRLGYKLYPVDEPWEDTDDLCEGRIRTATSGPGWPE